MDTNTQRFFESRYEEPVIESHGGEYKKTFPSFSLYSVFERKNLVEDPLIPDIWIRTGNGRFFESGNIEQALKDADLAPKNPDEALSFALAIVRIKYDCYYCIEDSDSFAGLIPDMYNKKSFYPVVEKHANGYTVRFHCYYPERRYAEFYSLYRKNLVEYIVTSTGNDYTVETGRVYRDGMDVDEIRFYECFIEHIRSKNLITDLTEFLDKRALYGITDPPDRAQVEQRKAELSRLWEQDFVVQHQELHFLTQKVFKLNPQFQVNSELLYEKTEFNRSTLDAIVQEIMQRYGTE